MPETKNDLYLEIARDIIVAFSAKMELFGQSPESYGEGLGQTFNILAKEIKKADLDLKNFKVE